MAPLPPPPVRPTVSPEMMAASGYKTPLTVGEHSKIVQHRARVGAVCIGVIATIFGVIVLWIWALAGMSQNVAIASWGTVFVLFIAAIVLGFGLGV